MGLFSRKRQELPEREYVYNRELVQRGLDKLKGPLFDFRNDESHKHFVNFLQKLVDSEVLEMTRTKELTSEAFAYHRGRIDGIRYALSLREKYILDEEHAKKIKGKKSQSDHKSKRTYMRAPTAAGLS